jgi:hypothetical protein
VYHSSADASTLLCSTKFDANTAALDATGKTSGAAALQRRIVQQYEKGKVQGAGGEQVEGTWTAGLYHTRIARMPRKAGADCRPCQSSSKDSVPLTKRIFTRSTTVYEVVGEFRSLYGFAQAPAHLKNAPAAMTQATYA